MVTEALSTYLYQRRSGDSIRIIAIACTNPETGGLGNYHFVDCDLSCQCADDAELPAGEKSLFVDSYSPAAVTTLTYQMGLPVCKKAIITSSLIAAK